MTRAARSVPQPGYTPAESKALAQSLKPWTGTMADLKAALETLRQDERPDRGDAAIRNAERFAGWLRLDHERVRLLDLERRGRTR